jgi:hypothetical protein
MKDVSETDGLGRRRRLKDNIGLDLKVIGVVGTSIGSDPSQKNLFEERKLFNRPTLVCHFLTAPLL